MEPLNEGHLGDVDCVFILYRVFIIREVTLILDGAEPGALFSSSVLYSEV